MRQDARSRLHRRRPEGAGLRRRRRCHRLLRHERPRHSRRRRRRRHRRPRLPTHRCSRPHLPRARGDACGCGRRRLHLDGLLAYKHSSGGQGGHPRLPPRHEGHAGRRRGPRDDRGGGTRHLPGRSNPRRHRCEQQGDRPRIHPHAARRPRRIRPPTTGASSWHGVHYRVRSHPEGDRPGPRHDLGERWRRWSRHHQKRSNEGGRCHLPVWP